MSPRRPKTRRLGATADYGRTASFLAIGVGLTGVITYLYFFIASHVLSKSDYGEVTVLWSAVFITVSTLYRPIDQLLSRHISEHLAKGEPVREPMLVATKIQLVLAAAFTVVALALRDPIQDGLLSGNETLYWIYLSAVLFYAASYFARGYLAGHRRFGLFTALILSESCFRTIFAVLVAIGISSGQSAVAIGIVAAPALSLLVVPAAFARKAKKPRRRPTESAAEGSEFSLSTRHRLRGGGAADHVQRTGLPQRRAADRPRLRGGRGGRVHLQRDDDRPRPAAALPGGLDQHPPPPHQPPRHAATRRARPSSTARFGWCSSRSPPSRSLVALVVIVAGPQLMQLAFSKKFTYGRGGLLLVTLGMGLYLSSVTVNQACVAQGQVRRAAARWIGCAAFFIGWCLLPVISEEFRRVEIGFAAHRGPAPDPPLRDLPPAARAGRGRARAGSTEELEARLAAARGRWTMSAERASVISVLRKGKRAIMGRMTLS